LLALIAAVFVVLALSIGVLHKPFTSAELSARVAQIMSYWEAVHTPPG
jgi:hypothetical protein